MTLAPQIQQLVKDMFSEGRVLCHIAGEEAAALGAVKQAAMLGTVEGEEKQLQPSIRLEQF